MLDILYGKKSTYEDEPTPHALSSYIYLALYEPEARFDTHRFSGQNGCFCVNYLLVRLRYAWNDGLCGVRTGRAVG